MNKFVLFRLVENADLFVNISQVTAVRAMQDNTCLIFTADSNSPFHVAKSASAVISEMQS